MSLLVFPAELCLVVGRVIFKVVVQLMLGVFMEKGNI